MFDVLPLLFPEFLFTIVSATLYYNDLVMRQGQT